MNILIYSHFFPPETGAAAVRMQYFAEALKPLDADIRIINPVPNYPNGKTLTGIKRFFYKENNITFLPIYIPKVDSPLKRLFSYCSYFISSLIYSTFSNYKPDLIISSSPPIFTSLAATILSKFVNAKFILDIRDIWPDIGIELGIIKNKSVAKILFSVEKYILSKAEYTIVTADGDMNNLINKGVPQDKILTVYNGADTKVFKPLKDSEKSIVRQNFGIPLDKKVLIYFGSYNYGMNDIETLCDALISLSKEGVSFHFVSVGNGNLKEGFINKIKGKFPFTHINSLNSEKVAQLIASSDLSLIPRKPIETDTGGNLPVKCFESWACGIPVLLSTIENTEISRIFDECASGKRIVPGDSNLFRDSILELLQKNELKRLGAKGYSFVKNNFDRKVQTEKIKRLIQSLF